MSNEDEEYKLIDSPLRSEITRDGITVEICIYRGEHDTTWILEVVDQGGSSHVWEKQFASDSQALDAFHDTVKQDGMKQFNPHYQRN